MAEAAAVTVVGGGGTVRVVAPVVAWSPVALPAPPVAGTGGAALTSFRAFRSGGPEAATLAVGCVATPIPGWVEDMRPAVTARAEGFAAQVAERIVGVPVALRGAGDGPKALHVVAGDDLRVGSARALVAFEHAEAGARVITCGVACAAPDHTARAAGATLACDGAVRDARVEGGTPPPAPGRALAAATWAVHHPSAAVALLGTAAALGLLAAVVTRRRPRSRL